VAVLVYLVYTGHQDGFIKKWNTFNGLYQANKEWFKGQYPAVYEQVENAIETMNKVTADNKIEWDEYIPIIKAVYPLVSHYTSILITHSEETADESTAKTE